jgi:hypothetical protein
VLVRPIRRWHVAHARKRNHHAEERQRVDGVGPRNAAVRNDETGERGSEHGRALDHRHIQVDRVRQHVARHEHRHHRVTCRRIERIHRRRDRGEHIDRPCRA